MAEDATDPDREPADDPALEGISIEPLDEALLESWIRQAANLPGWDGF